MFKHLKNALLRREAPVTEVAFNAELCPEQTIYAIGDIHGRLDVMERLLAAIDRDMSERETQNKQIVFLGDYIDRGDQSAEVLERLQTISQGENITCLLGNHEQMMLDFLDNPENRGPMWLRNSGLQTLASYRIGDVSERATAEQLVKARDRLHEALGENGESWLRHLPFVWQSGNIVCVHAGMDPDLGIQSQDARNFIWGHRAFLEKSRQDGLWVVHGHTIVEKARASGGRISIDTGAYFSGQLSAAIITPGNLSFLTG